MGLQPRKSDRLLLSALLVTAVLVSVAAVLCMPPEHTGGIAEQPSTFFNEPYGTKAAYLSLQHMGYRVRRLRRPIDRDTLQNIEALVILRPIQALVPHEQHVLLEWVRSGKTLLVAPEPPPATPKDPTQDSLTNWFRLRGEPSRPGAQRDILRIEVDHQDRVGLLENIHELAAVRGLRFEPEPIVAGPLAGCSVKTIWEDEGGVLVARIGLGEGIILALADLHAVTNEGLHESDSPLWLANLARELTRGDTQAAIAFDEYHAGFPYRDPSSIAIAKLMLAEGWGPSVVQVLVVVALGLYAHGARFGRPRDVLLRRRRRQGEFVTAAARLLHDGGATDVAYQTLRKHYTARICGVMHLPENTASDVLAAALRERGRPELARLVTTGSGALSRQRQSRRALLDWAARVHHELEILDNER